MGNIYISEGIDSVAVDGTDTIRSLGMTDVIVRKFNSNGQRVWTKRYGDIRHDRFTLGKVIDNRIFIYGTIDSLTTFEAIVINQLVGRMCIVHGWILPVKFQR
ncbi:MAG: hypothetical protein IPL69_19650 [Saprospiraceae bacterium]|nr:hypothetical protein [Candidatus Brachybacter algidus]